jgi:hypothetical protein
MVATIPPLLISKPTPAFPLRYGLLSAAVGPLDLPVHGRNGGLQYVNSMCGGTYGYEVACLDDQLAKTFENTLQTVLGVPFVVYSTFVCGPVGFTESEFQQLGLQQLMSVEQSIVEQVFSSGTFGQAPSLSTNPDVVTVTTTATDPVDVISALETEIYCTSGYGPPAYLHMPIAVFNHLKQEHLIDWDGNRWRTPMGSVVSSGCYTGLDPDGVEPADGTFWVYATGQTTLWRTPDSEVFVAPVEGALNRTTNQVNMLVEREYVVTFECAAYAAPVTLWTVGP